MADNISKFDDWKDLKDCNECVHYYNDVCDGAIVGSERPCKAFLATRRVDIPAQINALRTHLKWLYRAFFVETILLFLIIWGG